VNQLLIVVRPLHLLLVPSLRIPKRLEEATQHVHLLYNLTYDGVLMLMCRMSSQIGRLYIRRWIRRQCMLLHYALQSHFISFHFILPTALPLYCDVGCAMYVCMHVVS
jgi:hypothetical protein